MNGLHERLEAAAKGRTYRAIGDATGIHPETVRRYMQGQTPSVEFVTSLCTALDINVQWMLTGDGPMHAHETRRHALREADPGELLGAVAATLETLRERVDRVEVYVQTLEARLRGETEADAPSGRARTKRTRKGADDGTGTERAQRVADAIGERSREDAG